MTELKNRFEERLTSLDVALKNANNLADLVQTTAAEIEVIIGPNGSFAKSLTVREHSVLTLFFNSILMALDLLRLVRMEATPEISSRSAPPPSSSSTVPVAISAAVAAAAAIATPLAVPVIAVGVGALAGTAVGLAIPGFGAARHPEPKPEASMREPVVDITPMRQYLPAVLNMMAGNFDRLMDEMKAVREDAQNEKLDVPRRIEEIPNVLTFLHDILADQYDEPNEQTGRYARLVERILRVNGIELRPFQEGLDQSLFDVERSPRRGEDARKMLRPALLRDGMVIARGSLL